MKQEILARTVIDTIIRKFFRDMETDPDRSIRNMIDLAINFARGRFQKQFFQVLQEMLANEQSAYYDLVKHMAADMDHEKLRTFGMNLGFQACTLGADIIRSNEEKWNFNIPWTYHLMFGEEGLSTEYLDKIISEGKALGTYVYILSQTGRLTEGHTELLRKHDDCAFILLTVPQMAAGEQISRLAELSNLLLLIENQPDKIAEIENDLCRYGLLYGIYETCPHNHQEILWEPAHLDLIADTGAVFYVLMPGQLFDFEEDIKRSQAVSRIRKQQEYPFILIDFVSDIQKIDKVISNDSCAVFFDAEGCIHTDTGKWQGEPYNIKNRTLFEILEKVTKKKQAD